MLLVRLDYLGDFLTFLPFANSYRKRFPEQDIRLIIESKNLFNFASAQGLFKEIYTDGEFLRTDSFSIKRIFSIFRFLSKHMKNRYDLVILSTKHRNALLNSIAYLLGRGYVYGFTSGSAELILLKHIEEDTSLREPLRLLELLKLFDVGYEEDEIYPPLVVPRQASIVSYLSRFKKSIGIHPGGKRPTNRWMPTRFKSLICNIHTRYPEFGFIIMGTADEKSICDSVIDKDMEGYCANLAGRLDMDEFISIVSKLSFMICNDSGPMHISTMLNIPTIALFGRGVYERWCPLKKIPYFTAVYKKVACAPCWLWECRHQTCMKNITVDEVLKIYQSMHNEMGSEKINC